MWRSGAWLQELLGRSLAIRAKNRSLQGGRPPLFYQSRCCPQGARRMVEVVTQKVSLSVTDGSSMDAFVAQPTGNEQRPGLMLFQEAFGVNFHIRDVAERFAREGLTVIAPELFHRTAPPGIEIPYDKFSEAVPH